MKVTKVQKDNGELELIIHATDSDLASVKDHVLAHLNTPDLKIPGFRAGKAPLVLVEKHVNQQTLQEEFIGHAIKGLYKTAIRTEKIRPLSEPNITVLKFIPFSELQFRAIVSVLGDVKLPNYKKMKRPAPAVSIDAKDVSGVLDSLQKRLAKKTPSDKPAKDGDELLIDFVGSDAKNQPIAGADGKDYPLILGSKAFIPGFEEHLLGTYVGEKTSFTISFPKDYGVASLQSKKVTFKVTVQSINSLELPKLDDAFAKQAGPFKTLVELKKDIKKQLAHERQQEAENQYRNEILQAIADKSTLEVPEKLVDEQVELSEQDERQNLAYRGQTWDEHLKEEGVTQQQHRERNRPQARASVKAGLVLSEIAELENIDVTPEEVEIRIQLLKGQYQDPQMLAELDKSETRATINNRLRTEKTLDRLAQYARES